MNKNPDYEEIIDVPPEGIVVDVFSKKDFRGKTILTKVWVLEDSTSEGKCAKRIPVVLDIIKRIWEKHPNLSLMQLLCNADFPESDMYFTQDDKLIENLRRLYD